MLNNADLFWGEKLKLFFIKKNQYTFEKKLKKLN